MISYSNLKKIMAICSFDDQDKGKRDFGKFSDTDNDPLDVKT